MKRSNQPSNFQTAKPAHPYSHVHPENARPQMVFTPDTLDGETKVCRKRCRRPLSSRWPEPFMGGHPRSGEIKSISELARIRCGFILCGQNPKTEHTRPDIIEAIINGEEPSGLSLSKLVKTFPLDWSEQRAFFGFS